MSNSLQNKMLSGIMWTFLRQFSMQGFAFIQGIILARILAPSDYGLIAMTTFFFAISGCFIDSGFSTALIRKNDRSDIDISTVFVSNIGITFICAAMLCISSPFIASFYNEPILVKIICANAFLLFLNSFITIQNTKLTIDLDFKAQNLIRLTTNVIIGITAIVMAISGFGIWSLVLPNFLMPIINGFLYWKHSHWFPGFAFSKQSWKELFGYGSKILATNLINTIYDNMYPLIIGKQFSATNLGYYTRAQGYADMPSYTLRTILGPVAFPILSKINNDDQRLQNAYRKLIRLTGFLVFPLMIGLAALAKPAIVALVTEKWLPSVTYLQILCFALMFGPIQMLNLDLLQIKGRPDLSLKLEIIKKGIGLFILFASVPFGLLYMCVGQLISSILFFLLNTYYTGKLLNVSFIQQLFDIAPSLVYSILMGAFVYWTASWFTSPITQLLIGILSGGIFYYLISYFTRSSELQYLLDIIKDKIKNGKK